MSEIKTELQSRLKEAMKARDQQTLLTLRGLSAAIKQYEVDKRQDADDAVVTDIIQKEVKKRKDALQYAEQQNRDDLIEQNNSEIELLQSFLPEQLSEEELRATIKELIAGGANQIGAVMGALNKDYKGRFDGRAASSIAKEELGN